MLPRSRIVLPLMLGGAVVALILAASSSSAEALAQFLPRARTRRRRARGFDGAALPRTAARRDFTLERSVRPARLAGSLPRSGRGADVPVFDLRGPCIVIAQQVRGALDELAKPVPVLIVSATPAADTPR